MSDKSFNRFGFESHSYADDGQTYSSCLPPGMKQLQICIIECISKIESWMAANRLVLNPAKTEFLWFSTLRMKDLISHAPFSIGDVKIMPTTSTRLLGVLLDETLSLDGHINIMTRTCHYQLRRIKVIRCYIPMAAAIQLVQALVLSRIDYCNSVLLGLPDGQLNLLQSVLNVSVHLIFGYCWKLEWACDVAP